MTNSLTRRPITECPVLHLNYPAHCWRSTLAAGCIRVHGCTPGSVSALPGVRHLHQAPRVRPSGEPTSSAPPPKSLRMQQIRATSLWSVVYRRLCQGPWSGAGRIQVHCVMFIHTLESRVKGYGIIRSMHLVTEEEQEQEVNSPWLASRHDTTGYSQEAILAQQEFLWKCSTPCTTMRPNTLLNIFYLSPRGYFKPCSRKSVEPW